MIVMGVDIRSRSPAIKRFKQVYGRDLWGSLFCTPTIIDHISKYRFPYVVFRGVRKIEGLNIAGTYKRLLKESNILEVKKSGINLQISLHDYYENSNNATISYAYSRPACSNDALHKPNWATQDASIIMEDFYAELDDF
jgi:hypothetical protein